MQVVQCYVQQICQNMVTEHQISGGTKIDETETRITKKIHFNEECKNCEIGATGLLIVGKRRKRNNMTSITSKFCVEVLESDNKKDIKEWLGERGVSLHITYTNKI